MACSLRGVGWVRACRESLALRGLMACAGVVGMWVLQTDGASPLYVASQNGHVEVVRALVVARADVGQATVSEGVQRIERHWLIA